MKTRSDGFEEILLDTNTHCYTGTQFIKILHLADNSEKTNGAWIIQKKRIF